MQTLKYIFLLLDLPKVQPFSFPTMVQMQEKTSVVCLLKQGSQPLTFQWLKDNSKIHESRNMKIKTMDDVSILTIDPVSPSDSGNYTCFVSNAYGKDKHSARLIVEGNQKIFVSLICNFKRINILKS